MTDGAQIHASQFELFVRQLFRLFRVGSFHLPNNEAVLGAVDKTLETLRSIERESGVGRLSVMFVDGTVFVNGSLLMAPREVYEAAVDLSGFLERFGYNELIMSVAAEREHVVALAACFHENVTKALTEDPDAPVALRRVKAEVLASLRSTPTSPRDRLARAYASTVVTLRYVYENELAGVTVNPKGLKRLVQQFVSVTLDEPLQIVLLARTRNLHDDDAGRSVKAVAVTLACARLITSDVRILTRMAMAALFADLGRVRAASIAEGRPREAMNLVPALTDDQIRHLPAATALTMAILGGVHDESLQRAVIAYESQLVDWSEKPTHEDGALITIEACVVTSARRLVELMAFDVRAQAQLDATDAIEILRENAHSDWEDACVSLLTEAIHIDQALLSNESVSEYPLVTDGRDTPTDNELLDRGDAVKTRSAAQRDELSSFFEQYFGVSPGADPGDSSMDVSEGVKSVVHALGDPHEAPTPASGSIAPDLPLEPTRDITGDNAARLLDRFAPRRSVGTDARHTPASPALAITGAESITAPESSATESSATEAQPVTASTLHGLPTSTLGLELTDAEIQSNHDANARTPVPEGSGFMQRPKSLQRRTKQAFADTIEHQPLAATHADIPENQATQQLSTEDANALLDQFGRRRAHQRTTAPVQPSESLIERSRTRDTESRSAPVQPRPMDSPPHAVAPSTTHSPKPAAGTGQRPTPRREQTRAREAEPRARHAPPLPLDGSTVELDHRRAEHLIREARGDARTSNAPSGSRVHPSWKRREFLRNQARLERERQAAAELASRPKPTEVVGEDASLEELLKAYLRENE